jgi:UPF0755 protein
LRENISAKFVTYGTLFAKIALILFIQFNSLDCKVYAHSILRVCPDCELVRKKAKYLVGICAEETSSNKKEGEGCATEQPVNKKDVGANKFVDFDILPNMSLFEIANQLKEKKLIKSKWFFVLSALFRGKRKLNIPGRYRFFEIMKTNEIIDHIHGRNFVLHKITVPEGYTVVQILKLMAVHKCLSGNVHSTTTEGTLLPGTYYFSKNEQRENVLIRMKKAMTDLINDIKITNGISEVDLVTLASIVEKETSRRSEVETIAGVFLARLQKKMPLQADPTVIYGLLIKGEWPPGKVIKRSDWKIDHPHNTYIYTGLPPTPICCPGKNTLRMVATAKPGKFLYFVANKEGIHEFSETLATHNKNIAKIKKSLAEGYAMVGVSHPLKQN